MLVNQEESMLGVSSEYTEEFNCKQIDDFLIFYSRWADLGYKKQNSGSKWKKPFGKASHAAGIVVEKVAVERS